MSMVESDYLKVLKGSYGAENGKPFQSFMRWTCCVIMFSQPLSCSH